MTNHACRLGGVDADDRHVAPEVGDERVVVPDRPHVLAEPAHEPAAAIVDAELVRGTVEWVRIDVGEGAEPQVPPEDRLRIAMARQ